MYKINVIKYFKFYEIANLLKCIPAKRCSHDVCDIANRGQFALSRYILPRILSILFEAPRPFPFLDKYSVD